MKTDLKKPCRACPWRRTSAPTYLGSATPEEFLQVAMADAPMPCHLTIDYDRDDWKSEENLAKAQSCAGVAVFFANISKLSRDPKRLHLLPDRERVFTRPDEFLEHHKALTEGSFGQMLERLTMQHPGHPKAAGIRATLQRAKKSA